MRDDFALFVIFMNDSKKRSFVKIITWHLLAMSFTLGIVYFFTGQLITSAKVTFSALTVGMVLFYVHERIWDKIKWGKTL